MSANMANSAIHPFGVDKWIVSWTQAFVMHIGLCVVAPPEECLRVKVDMVLFASDTVWFISERVRGVRENALYKLTLPLFLSSTSGTTATFRFRWYGSRSSAIRSSKLFTTAKCHPFYRYWRCATPVSSWLIIVYNVCRETAIMISIRQIMGKTFNKKMLSD